MGVATEVSQSQVDPGPARQGLGNELQKQGHQVIYGLAGLSQMAGRMPVAFTTWLVLMISLL